MTRFLLLRLEAPLMAFGGPMVDQISPTRRFPGQAQITGLLGNALGYRHADAEALEALQHRLRFAAALVEPGEALRDYHTVDLGRRHLAGTGWTTQGRIEARAGASSETTHIRIRWYRADARVLVALTLDPAQEAPVIEDLGAALAHPARPLFIGRKACLPSAPIALGDVQAPDALTALREARALLEREDRAGTPRGGRRAEFAAVEMDRRLATAAELQDDEGERLVDRRDWRNQMHTGERRVLRPKRGLADAGAS